VTRQARALVTRASILDAAAHEFAAEGFQAASLSKILERSGVTKGAMYFHFASKESMARSVADVMSARLPEVVEQWTVRGQDPLTTAVHVAVGFAELLRDEIHCRGGLRVVSEGALGPEHARWPYDFWETVHVDLLGEASSAGSLRAGVDPVELARLVVALGTGVRSVCLAAGELAALRERTAASWTVLLAGVASPDWLARWEAAGGMATVPGGRSSPRAGVADDVVGGVP
jgi:AcrR family transcriptional regulator